MGCIYSAFISDIPPPKEILPDPAANEAFEAYFRNLNEVYFDNWQVFKGDARAQPPEDLDENRWLYVKGKGNAFSTQVGPGYIYGTKAALKNYKPNPENGKMENEKLWRVEFDKARCKCEWGSDFEDPDCPVVDGFYVGDDMHWKRGVRNEDYQMKWRTTRTLVFKSKDESAAPVEVVIITTGAFHVKIDKYYPKVKKGQKSVPELQFGGKFCALKSVVTIDGHPPFSIDLTSHDLKYELPGEFSGEKLTEDDHKKWLGPKLKCKAPSFKTKVESGKLHSGMKLLLAFVLNYMLVQDEKGQDSLSDMRCSWDGYNGGILQHTVFKMGHVFPLRGTEFERFLAFSTSVSSLLEKKCKGYYESRQRRQGWLCLKHSFTGDYNVTKRDQYPDVAAVKLEGVQRYGY
jgi:hypothetical protein